MFKNQNKTKQTSVLALESATSSLCDLGQITSLLWTCFLVYVNTLGITVVKEADYFWLPGSDSHQQGGFGKGFNLCDRLFSRLQNWNNYTYPEGSFQRLEVA